MNLKIVLFYHSLLSDWNHGNAHFLRGLVTQLLKMGHHVQVMEPESNWSLTNLINEQGITIIDDFHEHYPLLSSSFYTPDSDFQPILSEADLVIVHEWNEPELVQKLGNLKSSFDYILLFHDTHHRAATQPLEMQKYDLTNYDGVLAFGDIIRDLYLENQWTKRAWTWHEAADVERFKPQSETKKIGDLVWIGNWGDDERTQELIDYIIEPVKLLNLSCTMYGVRYPQSALDLLKEAKIEYGGYLPSFKVPSVFASFKFTVHVPRRPYVEKLPGIPTIRPFEAMACGIPLISAPWQDRENLFRVNEDFIMVQNPDEMVENMFNILMNQNLAEKLSESGLKTILSRHTCYHRAEELLKIYRELKL